MLDGSGGVIICLLQFLIWLDSVSSGFIATVVGHQGFGYEMLFLKIRLKEHLLMIQEKHIPSINNLVSHNSSVWKVYTQLF